MQYLMSSHEQKTSNSFQETAEATRKAVREDINSTNQRKKHRDNSQNQRHKNTNLSQQCIRYQLHEFTNMKKSRNQEQRMRASIDSLRHETKWNHMNYERNEKNENENCQSWRRNSVQQDENVRTQNYAENELATKAQP